MLKKSPIDKIVAPLSKFIHLEYTSGIILLLGVVIALFWANFSPDSYHHFWEINFSLVFGDFQFNHSLHTWINDGLMAIFFFVIGLELKREFMVGELSTLKKASLPMVAALGGMAVPALIYYTLNSNTEAVSGWGIPMATDIAFALAILSMAGKHIPSSIKVFLSALAVADDLGAILIIAFFYTSSVNFWALGIAIGFLILLILGGKLGVRSNFFYLLLGICVWIGFLVSGVHATIAGVLVAFTIPATTKIDETGYANKVKTIIEKFGNSINAQSKMISTEIYAAIDEVKFLSNAATPPLQKLENNLHPYVAFIIMPLFAVANSGIIIGKDILTDLVNPVSIGVASGLLFGKFIGILLFTWIFVKLGYGVLPKDANWRYLSGVALLGGIGFTMSLFISGLAFKNPIYIDQAKYGILVASLIAGIIGWIILKNKPSKQRA